MNALINVKEKNYILWGNLCINTCGDNDIVQIKEGEDGKDVTDYTCLCKKSWYLTKKSIDGYVCGIPDDKKCNEVEDEHFLYEVDETNTSIVLCQEWIDWSCIFI